VSDRGTQRLLAEVQPLLRAKDLLTIQQIVGRVPAGEHLVNYAVDLVRATRPKEPQGPAFASNWIACGAGPRAAQYLILGAKARAVLHGRLAVAARDIRGLVRPVLRHRVFTNFNADAEGVDVD
jgi:MoxR-like ATPase